MDATFIKALTRQALTAYTKGGQPALDQWKANLPAQALADFEKFCSEPMNEAIASLDPLMHPKEDAPADPRKQHKDDPRRAKPI